MQTGRRRRSSRNPSFSTTRRLAWFSGRIVASTRMQADDKEAVVNGQGQRGRNDAPAGIGASIQ